jgi:phage/plasmid-associated DNA primase
MKNWRPYFMSILIHWYQIYQEEMRLNHRVEEPEEVLVATNRYKHNNDKFNDFFEECVTEGESIVPAKTIYNLFSNWWITNNNNNKIPDMKEMIRAFQIKFGEEDYIKHRGFYVQIDIGTNDEIDRSSDY